MYPAALRYDVLRAREAGLGARTIERLTGIPPRSQRRIALEEIPFGMSDALLHQRRRVGRPPTLALAFREIIDLALAQQPDLRVTELLRRLRSDHDYPGGKNPVYAYVAQHRPPAPGPLPTVRFEGVAGEFAQFDFGTLTVPFLEGTSPKLTFFAGRLKYSRAFHVLLVPGEGAEPFLRGMEACGEAWGGLPLFNVVDNLKAAVVRRERDPQSGKERIRFNPHFARFLQEVGVFGEPTAPYSGNQKGSVENLIRFIKEGFLTARRFVDRSDLERQLGEWRYWVNHVRPCEATGVPPRQRWEEERARLRPLPWGPRGYGLAYPAVVGRDARVRWGGCAYSTPPGWMGQPVELRVHRELVRLQHAGEECLHPRTPENGRYSLLPAHREALFVKPRGRIMAQRQILMDLGPAGEAFFTELVHRRPHTWREQDLPAVWQLFETVGPARLTAAFQRCVAQEQIGAEYLQAHLEGWAAEVAA